MSESMFNQSYEYKEIIFLDDGSKDNSKILKKYENNIKIVKKNYQKKYPSYDQFKKVI